MTLTIPMNRVFGGFAVAGPGAGERAPRFTLEKLNAARASANHGEWTMSAEAFFHARHRANHRLAVYGSLGPGRRNHHVLEPLGGSWRRGTVRGRLYLSGWGAGRTYPGLRIDPAGDEIGVQLLTSASLASEWGRLDAFEGDEYVRLLAAVCCERTGYTIANIYTVRLVPEAAG